jgi:hypothetical protein
MLLAQISSYLPFLYPAFISCCTSSPFEPWRVANEPVIKLILYREPGRVDLSLPMVYKSHMGKKIYLAAKQPAG